MRCFPLDFGGKKHEESLGLVKERHGVGLGRHVFVNSEGFVDILPTVQPVGNTINEVSCL